MTDLATLSSQSKIDKMKALKTGSCFLHVNSFAESSSGAFCNTFELHLAIIFLENLFLSSFEWLLQTVHKKSNFHEDEPLHDKSINLDFVPTYRKVPKFSDT